MYVYVIYVCILCMYLVCVCVCVCLCVPMGRVAVAVSFSERQLTCLEGKVRFYLTYLLAIFNNEKDIGGTQLL